MSKRKRGRVPGTSTLPPRTFRGEPDTRKVEVNADGSLTVPLSDEAMEAIEMQLDLFREKFGREPAPNDPIFFDPDEDEPVAMSVAKMEEHQRRALRNAAVEAGHTDPDVYVNALEATIEARRIELGYPD